MENSITELFIGGLPWKITAEELQELICDGIPNTVVEIRTDKETGRSKGFGYIIVPDIAYATLIINTCDGGEINGRRIFISFLRTANTAKINTNNSLVEYFSKYPEEIKTINHRKFEELIASIFERYGYSVEHQKQTHDRGVDIIAIKEAEINTRVLIQCKRPNSYNKVSIAPIRELFGVKQDMGASKAILVTSTSFTRDAQQFIDKHPWELEGKDYNDILDWLNEVVEIAYESDMRLEPEHSKRY